MSNWVAAFDEPLFAVENLDGLWWHEVEPPSKRHKHTGQTRWWKNLEYGERCACGAFRDRDGWFYMGNDKPRVAEGILGRVGL